MFEDIDIAPALPSPMFLDSETAHSMSLSPNSNLTIPPAPTADTTMAVSLHFPESPMQHISASPHVITERRHASSLTIAISPRPIFKIVPLLDNDNIGEPKAECVPIPLEKENDDNYFVSEGYPTQPSLLDRLSDPQELAGDNEAPKSSSRQFYPLPPKPIGRRFLLENNLLILGNHFLGNSFYISPRSAQIDNVLAQCSNASIALSRFMNHEQGYYRPEHVTPILPVSVCNKLDDLTAQMEASPSPLRRNHIKRERDQLRDHANWEYFLNHNDYNMVD